MHLQILLYNKDIVVMIKQSFWEEIKKLQSQLKTEQIGQGKHSVMEATIQLLMLKVSGIATVLKPSWLMKILYKHNN